jgi:hypothetical protein
MVGQEAGALTESQLAALEKAKLAVNTLPF